MKGRIVIYHGRCIDGFTAAWVLWKKYGDHDTEYLAANYGGDARPDVTGRDVVIVDFSYPRSVMTEINEAARSLVVLDHHKSAAADLAGFACKLCVFDMTRSGAGLAWDHVFPGQPRSWLVNYVEDRDLWRFALLRSREVNAWIGACVRSTFQAWSRLEAIGAEDAAKAGEAVLAYVDRYVGEMSEQARNIDFAGYRVPCVNAPYISISELLGFLAETAPFAIGWYQDNAGIYRYSLRSRGEDAIDVSEIAKRYGGGGHKNSAGFESRTRVDE